jgi:GNAT superfamily N-acetyltransferase
LENVVAHPAYQSHGHGRAVVEAALARHGPRTAITF